MELIDEITSISLIVGAVVSIVTIILAYRQMKKGDLIASADFLLRIVDKFNSDPMVKSRKEIMTIYKRDHTDYKSMDECRDVFDFFEDLSLLHSKGIIPGDLVHSDFNYWILRYWTIFEKYFLWMRENDSNDTLYGGFQDLYRQMDEYDLNKQKHFLKLIIPGKKIHVEITAKDADEFVNEEINLTNH